jgi:hypothetical protein
VEKLGQVIATRWRSSAAEVVAVKAQNVRCYMLWYVRCYSCTQMICKPVHSPVDSPALRQRRQGVSCYNKPLFTWAAKQEAKRPTAWTFLSGGAYWETQLQIETSSNITLTQWVSCEQLRPCSTASLRAAVPESVPEGDDEEFDVSHISTMCIKSFLGRRGKY